MTVGLMIVTHAGLIEANVALFFALVHWLLMKRPVLTSIWVPLGALTVNVEAGILDCGTCI